MSGNFFTYSLLFISGNFIFLNTVGAYQEEEKPPISFEDFVEISEEAQTHRADRLVSIDEFLKMSRQTNTIILDTRSKEAYDLKHLKGAVHLDFSDFTQEKLAKVVPNKQTRILIYCNNNFKDDPIAFASKMVMPSKLTLALNIPTFINLYGYGYQNIYELNSYLSVDDKRLEFESAISLQ